MAEFALMLPLLIVLLLGVIEFGRFTYFSIVVGNAAHAGAEYGAQSQTNGGDIAGMEAAATADGQNNIANITPLASQVCACWNNATSTSTPSTPTAAACGQTCTTGQRVVYAQVHTTGTYSPLFTYPGLPSTFTVSAQAIMRVPQ
jgi:Flp pilus assembly protein TadG